MIEINRTCPMCGEMKSIKVSEDVLPAIMRYDHGIGYIQDIPLSASEREFIKTGYCMECQEILFANPWDDEEEDEYV